MNLDEPTTAERGKNMNSKVREAKHTYLIAALLGLAVVSIFAADAFAMYNPSLGRFMQRDPGADVAKRVGAGGQATGTDFIPLDQYADGMNLYQYVRSQPTRYSDPTGTRIFVSAQGDIANKAQGALENLCPCFRWDAGSTGNMIEIKIKTYQGKDAKGNKKILPYNPNDEAAKKSFCKCYLPEKSTKNELDKIYGRWSSLSDNDRRRLADEFAKAASGIKGERGHVASCTLVAQAISSSTQFVILGKEKGPSITNGSVIDWNYNNRDWITGPISLGHELVHATYGIGGGTLNEIRLVGYENALRWEGGQSLRLDYAGAPVAQLGNPLLQWPKIDKCECPDRE